MRVTVHLSPGEAVLLPPPPAPRDGVEWLTAAHGGDAAFVDAAAPHEVGVVCAGAGRRTALHCSAPLHSAPRHFEEPLRSTSLQYSTMHHITVQ